MIEHVFKRCQFAKNIDKIFIAACDEEVKTVAESFGCKVIMTDKGIERPALRVASACDKLNLDDDDIIVVVQGDEPLIHPEMIDLAVAPLLADPSIQVGTLIANATEDEWLDTNEVKVVVDLQDNIMFMTRSPVPSNTRNAIGPRLKQVAIMPFRKKFLVSFDSLPMLPYEMVESIELLRALENGIKVKGIRSGYQSISVDTEPDRRDAETLMKVDPFFPLYSEQI
jgi:3-deoxy-manno-octulosonate cytidylyltransferase (CMP-KDO synthetase)